MKKVIATLSLVFCFVMFSNAQEVATPNIDPNAPDLKFDSEVVDYGVLEYDGNTLREFKFKNTTSNAKNSSIVLTIKGEVKPAPAAAVTPATPPATK
ncbi:MAG: hypothetical protein IPG89_18640 [Bacteroidetes bacterium]|nr:hypothetical protein [Bacteroidota bacterium]